MQRKTTLVPRGNDASTLQRGISPCCSGEHRQLGLRACGVFDPDVCRLIPTRKMGTVRQTLSGGFRAMPTTWKKGRGKLGVLDPLLGDWIADVVTPRGPVRCRRTLAKTLGGARIEMRVRWEFGKDRAYEELAIIGVGDDRAVRF